MTENQKRVYQEIRRIRKEPFVLLVSGFFLLVLFSLIAFAVLTSEDRKLDSLSAVASVGGIYVIVMIIILVARYFRDTHYIKILGDRDAALVLDELPDGKKYRSIKAMLTRNFLVNLQVGMYAIPTEDVLLIFFRQHRVNYIPTQVEIVIKTRSGRELSIASRSYFSRKNKKRQEELIRDLYEKNPRIMIGYSNENLYAYQKETVQPRDLSNR
jgi:hypothetical protein